MQAKEPELSDEIWETILQVNWKFKLEEKSDFEEERKQCIDKLENQLQIQKVLLKIQEGDINK